MHGKTLLASASSLLLWVTAHAETLKTCAGQPYYASMYTCFDDFLCPIVGGVATQRCGTACYSPGAYSCNAGGALAPVSNVVTPKVFIISMFEPEGNVWYDIADFDLYARNITVPGLSPLYPDVHCTADGSVCELITGESEINAACTITALVHSPLFDLKTTYFMVAGIAGVNPEVATIGGVSFNRYTVQVALEYEFDAREIPSNWTTGYFAQGSYAPGQYPQSIYGTEVFEFNDALRQLAIGFAKTAKLNDSADAVAYRAMYANNSAYHAATLPPSVIACDGATSDVYYSGALLGQALGDYLTLVTNGTGVYCATAQEDSATAESILRAALFGLVDFSRIIVMRTFSDMDRPYPGQSPVDNLLYSNQGAFLPSIANIYLAGIKVVEGILNGWDSKFAAGIPATNYVGDILGSLGGNPDFGLPSQFIGSQVHTKRSLHSKTFQAKRNLLPVMPVRGLGA